MTRWSGNIRWINFMNEIGWQGRTDWDDSANVIPFIVWVQDHERYIPEANGAVFHSFFFEDIKQNTKSYYFNVDQGRAALHAVYNQQQIEIRVHEAMLGLVDELLNAVSNILNSDGPTVHERQAGEQLLVRAYGLIYLVMRSRTQSNNDDFHKLILRTAHLCMDYKLYANAVELVNWIDIVLADIHPTVRSELDSIGNNARKELYKKYDNGS